MALYRPDHPVRQKVLVKLYLVFQRKFAARGDTPNIELFDAALTKEEARDIVNRVPGTFIQKVLATRPYPDTTSEPPTKERHHGNPRA